ncbi:MAG TPA: hypothetical protein VGH14_07790 [Solirubrobacterales bacterium]
MDSKIGSMAEAFESRRADDEAAAIAAERVRSGGLSASNPIQVSSGLSKIRSPTR